MKIQYQKIENGLEILRIWQDSGIIKVPEQIEGCGMVLDSPDTGRAPILSGTSAVYGRVCGDVHLTDTALIISGEEICNDSLDTLVMDGKGRSVIRDPSRDELAPQEPEPQQKGHKERGQSR